MITIKLQQFEGPLELLLELINAKNLEISQVSLAEVTDQYIASIGDIEYIHPRDLSDFLVVAATLLLIKSRVMLPDIPTTDEEEREMISLEERLKEYQRYRAAATILKGLAARRNVILVRALWQGFAGGFFPPSKPLHAMNLSEALKKVLEELTEFARPYETRVLEKIVSLEDKIREVLSRIERTARLTLDEVVGTRSRRDVVLAFLALLFLFKTKAIMLSQKGHFSKIEIIKPDTV